MTNNLDTVVNRIRKLIDETKSATYPDRMEVSALPPERDSGIEAANRAQVLEALVKS